EDAARVPKALAMTGDCMRLPARLIRLEPTKASPGDVVQIIGTDLGPETGKVTLNGEDAEASGWTGQRVTFTVPSNAHSGQVRVATRERTSNGLVLTVAPNVAPVAGFSARRLGRH